jgi:hypothetical protein
MPPPHRKFKKYPLKWHEEMRERRGRARASQCIWGEHGVGSLKH